MERFWKQFKIALRLVRWPVMTPEQVRLEEQKKKIKRLYGE